MDYNYRGDNIEFLKEIDVVMEMISYGYIDKDNNIHKDIDDFKDKYYLQSPDELMKTKVGVCWDQVELERYLFNKAGINTISYAIVYYYDNCPTHTFITFNYDHKIYWYEHSWETYRGLHCYENEFDLLKDVKEKWIKYQINNGINVDINNVYIYEYQAPPYNISCREFYNFFEKGKEINI